MVSQNKSNNKSNNKGKKGKINNIGKMFIKRENNNTWIILGLVVVVGLVVYYFYTKNNDKTAEKFESPTTTSPTSPMCNNLKSRLQNHYEDDMKELELIKKIHEIGKDNIIELKDGKTVLIDNDKVKDLLIDTENLLKLEDETQVTKETKLKIMTMNIEQLLNNNGDLINLNKNCELLNDLGCDLTDVKDKCSSITAIINPTTTQAPATTQAEKATTTTQAEAPATTKAQATTTTQAEKATTTTQAEKATTTTQAEAPATTKVQATTTTQAEKATTTTQAEKATTTTKAEKATTTTQAEAPANNKGNELSTETQEMYQRVRNEIAQLYNSSSGELSDFLKEGLKSLTPSQRKSLCNCYCTSFTPCTELCKLTECANCTGDALGDTDMSGMGLPDTSLGYAGVDDQYVLLDNVDDNTAGLNVDANLENLGNKSLVGPHIVQKDTNGISNIFAPYIIMTPKRKNETYGTYLLEDPNDPFQKRFVESVLANY